jgi:hypothetical protein
MRLFDLLPSWDVLLWGAVAFVATSVGGLVLVSYLLVKLPSTYFCDSHPPFWIERHPFIRWIGLFVKNALGIVAVVLGIVMSLPGIPGQGILTILLGVMLLDFPGKRRLERWIISRRAVLDAVNRLRDRYQKPPFVL